MTDQAKKPLESKEPFLPNIISLPFCEVTQLEIFPINVTVEEQLPLPFDAPKPL